MKKTTLFLFLSVTSLLSFGVTKTAVLTGDWNTATTWSPLGVPTANDTVVINTLALLSVNVTTTNAVCKQLTVTGVLGTLNINTGAVLTVGGNVIMSCALPVDINTINVNGTMTIGGNLLMNYTDGLATLSSSTFNIGNNTASGTLNVTGNIAFTGNTTRSPSIRSQVVLRNGTVNLTGNITFTASGSAGGAGGVMAFVQDDDTFDNKTKVVNMYGNIVNASSGRIELYDANKNAPCTWRYVAGVQQNLVTTNVTYRHIEVANTNSAELWLVNNFPNASITGNLIIKGGSTLNTKTFNMDAISSYANQIQVQANGILRIEQKDGVPTQKVSGNYVCVCASTGIIDYYASTAATSLDICDESFNYPILRLSGPGIKVMNSKDIDNSDTYCNRVELTSGTFSIAKTKKLKLTSVLDKTVYVNSGTIVWINGDFKELDAFWSINYNSNFHYIENGTQNFYTYKNSTGAVEPYGSVTLRRASGINLTNRELVAGDVVKIRGKLDIQGNIKLNINQGSTLELSSDVTYTGWIGEIPTSSSIAYLGTPAGKIVARKYIRLTDANYRDFSSPIASTTLASWQKAGLYMTGFNGSLYPNFGFISAYQYDETNTGAINDGFIGASNITNLTATRNASSKITRGGWRIYTGEPLPAGQTYTLSDTGQINTGNITFNASFTHGANSRATVDGWNFFGNPYPSAVNWSLVYADASNTASFAANGISPTVYCWKPTDAGVPFDEEDSYGFYNAATGVGTRQTNLIPSYGGFWVKTYHATANSANWDLILKESHKGDQATTTFAKDNDDVNETVVKVGLGQQGAEDEIWFHPFQGATVGVDHMYDVERFGDIYGTPNINFSENGNSMNLWVNALPEDAKEVSMPIQVYLPLDGEFTIRLTNIEGFAKAYGCVKLVDQITGLVYPIFADTVLTFTGTKDYRGDRFTIIGTRNLSSQIDVGDATCFEKEDGLFALNLGGSSQNANFSLYKNGSLYNSYTGNISNITESLGRGQYQLVNNSGVISCTSNKFDFEIKSYPQVTAAFESPVQWPQNSFVPLQNLSEGATSYEWTFSDANAMLVNKTPYYFFEQPGKFKISLVSKNQFGCYSNTASRDITVLSTTGIENVSKGNITVYGTEGGLMIKTLDNEAMHVWLYAVDGRLLYDGKVSGTNVVPVERSSQMLLVRIKTAKGEYTDKVLY